jgi:hypothetical protein
MNKHHREEGKSGRDVGLIGERTQKVSGYDTPAWKAVDKMLDGDHPTTNMGTIACGSSHMGGHHNTLMSEQKKMVDGGKGHMHKKSDSKKQHFAAGGVGKVRKGEY